MKDQIKYLGELSAIDEKIRTINKNRESLPDQIDELTKQVAREKGLLDEKIARRDELQKKRRAFESDLADNERKIEADKDKEMRVRNNEEFHAIQREIKAAKDKQGEIEEQILIIMEATSEFDKEIARAEKRFNEFNSITDEQITALQAVLDGSLESLGGLEETRNNLLGQLNSDIIVRYNGLVSRKITPPVVKAMDGICSGCHSMILPQLYNQILAEEAMYHCPSCSRLLIATEDEEE